MLIRKNHASNILDYHKTIRQTEYDEETISNSRLSDEALDYRTFDVQDLVQKIKDQQGQIQKLLTIIDKYKNKIEEFEQYEEVIKDFLARKQKQKTQPQHKNFMVQKNTESFESIIKPNIQALQKAKKQCIVPSFSITILCQNQRNPTLKQENQKYELFETPKRNRVDFVQQTRRKDQQKQNKMYRTNYKDKGVKQPLVRGSRSFIKSNSTFDINHSIHHSIPFIDQNEFREDNKVSLNQRVPSLSNMRRIQKCFKLLKN